VRFQKLGRSRQLAIESAGDLQDVLDLPAALWAATSAPTGTFRCDPRFLALVDVDANGRLYTFEIKLAIEWLLQRLVDKSLAANGADALPLDAIRADDEEGRAIHDSARFVLESLGKRRYATDAQSISLDQVRTFTAQMKERALNGSGVIRPEAAPDPDTEQLIADATACTGGTEDPSGALGVTEEQMSAFAEAVRAHLAWLARAEIPAGEDPTPLMPLGARTPGAYGVYSAHATEVDRFFELSHALRYEPRTAPHIEGPPEGLDAAEPDAVQEYLQRAPMCHPTADGALPLQDDAVNPAYREWVGALKESVLATILGGVPEALPEGQWRKVKSAMAPYEAYLKDKQGGAVEGLTAEQLTSYRDGPCLGKADELVAMDHNVAAMLATVGVLERLLLYQQHLMELVNNFVSFPRLYAADRQALFETGSAVIDGRRFTFAVRVENRAVHSAIAKTSDIFILYLDVTAKVGGEKFCVAVPATWGTKGNLAVGKQGVFFDIDGKEYDAKVVQMIENPICLDEALVAPFVRLWGFVTSKVEGLYTTAEKKLQARLEKAGTALSTQQAPAPPVAGSSPANLVVGVSLAVAALGSAFAFITKQLEDVDTQKVLIGLLCAVLVVLIPLTIIALLKLRSQDLSALLEGCGWAINARMRLKRAQRKMFTVYGAYPEGARGTPMRPWVRLVLGLVIAAAALAGIIYGARALADYRDRVAAEQAEEGQRREQAAAEQGEGTPVEVQSQDEGPAPGPDAGEKPGE
jgi:hypothetical protein